jgi:glycosyltransferase involved in cell wall biosynthesis
MKSPPIIFISIPWFTPAYKAGGPIQSILNLVSRSNQHFRYFIFCGHQDINATPLENIQTDQWHNFNDHTLVYYCSKKTKAALKSQIAIIKPDLLYIIGLFSYPYNIFPMLFIHHPKKILSVRGMLHPGALEQKSIKKRIFLSLIRSLGIHNKIRFHVTDAQEAMYVKSIFGKKISLQIAGNYPAKVVPIQHPSKNKGKIRLLTIALISPMKNHLVVLKSLSLCKSSIEYHIIGAVKDQSYWQECLQWIGKLPEHIKVLYHGEQPPAHLKNYYEISDLMIMPSQSENFGHALIEGLGVGLPVITSRFTPWNNLELQSAGKNVEIQEQDIAVSVDGFAEMDEAAFNSWRAGAKQYAQTAITMEVLDQEYEALFA